MRRGQLVGTGDGRRVTTRMRRGQVVARVARGAGATSLVGRRRQAAAIAVPSPTPSVTVISSRASVGGGGGGGGGRGREVMSARPPATNRKMLASNTSGTADSAPLRRIHHSAS